LSMLTMIAPVQYCILMKYYIFQVYIYRYTYTVLYIPSIQNYTCSTRYKYTILYIPSILI